MENKLQHTCATTREFALQLLEHITNNFSEERIIGRGGYGVVYKGVLEDGQEIAVKKLHHMPGLDDKQFRNEFNNFMRAQHQNIVRLVGYCYDIGHQRIKHNGEYIFAHVEERLLCFEYLQGGSLDKHVSDESCRLDWPSCYKIIKGVCEGLNYLHNGSKDPMYHLDLKPANILLDKDMTPKIGDFGLSRFFPSAHTYITTKIVGTRGYMPPEYIDRYQITPKFDVFSLGVIIIQIMAGRVGYSKCADIPSQEFIKLVHENWRKKMQPTMLSHTSHGVKTCIEIALRCVETDRVKRPTIAEIVNELNKIDTTIVDELNEFDDTKSSPIAQCRSLERKLGGLMHKVSDLRSKQAFNQYASSGGRLLPLPDSAKPLRGHVYSHYLRRRNLRKKWVRWLLLLLSVVGWSITCFWFWFFLSQNSMQVEVRRKSLPSMRDQYASMVQDQFSVSMYYLQALAILVSTFHHSQNPSAIDQTTSAWYAKRTAFEVRVMHAEREQGWSTTKMWSSKNKSPGRWDAAAAAIRQPAEEYAPVIFAQDSNAHVLSFDILSGDIVLMADEFYSRSLRGEIDSTIWEDSQNFSSIEEQPSQIEEPSVYLRSKNKRSKTEQEDDLLVQAWLNTSLDAAISNEQTRDSYWTMIHHYFHNNKQFVSVRNQNSLSNHWGTIQEQVNKLCGYYDRIQNRRQSGMTAQDRVCTLYQTEDTEGRSIGLLHCLSVLEHHPNWTSRLSQKKQKTASNASPTTSSLGMTSSNDDEVEASTLKHEPLRRPTSKKAQKKRLRRDKSFASSDSSPVMLVLDKMWSKKIEREDKKEAKKEAWYERALAMEEKMVALEESKQAIEKNKIALEQQKLDFQRRSDDERIMSMNVSAMTEPQQQYYISLQREIIARRYSTLG